MCLMEVWVGNRESAIVNGQWSMVNQCRLIKLVLKIPSWESLSRSAGGRGGFAKTNIHPFLSLFMCCPPGLPMHREDELYVFLN
jgi:hypothetical protein